MQGSVEATPPPPATTGYRWTVPRLLVALRLLLAPLAILLVLPDWPRWLWMVQFLLAIVSDIYDGKLARRWGTSSAGLRRADSIVDSIYTFACLAAFWLAEPQIIAAHWPGIVLVMALDLMRRIIDWSKFGRAASYHAHSMRAFGVSLIPVAILLLGFGQVYWVLWASLAIGCVAQLEALAMSLVLPRWTCDVKHLGIALALRRASRRADSHRG
ncbi:CDP-alcohol phosphatidyltransferase family protein [Microbulbifer sp. SAOS-129_SWC]|uniref:CDP-alcohol phosphatidyltransferase family protein n=1 Tax=Microbulbifer sp. SAOS-129_SWC TaxID=3145235 RepID=UPI003216E319